MVTLIGPHRSGLTIGRSVWAVSSAWAVSPVIKQANLRDSLSKRSPLCVVSGLVVGYFLRSRPALAVCGECFSKFRGQRRVHSLVSCRCIFQKAQMNCRWTALSPSCWTGRIRSSCVVLGAPNLSECSEDAVSNDKVKGHGKVNGKATYSGICCSLHFSWSWWREKTMSTIEPLARKPHCDSGKMRSATFCKRITRTQAKVLPMTLRRANAYVVIAVTSFTLVFV